MSLPLPFFSPPSINDFYKPSIDLPKIKVDEDLIAVGAQTGSKVKTGSKPFKATGFLTGDLDVPDPVTTSFLSGFLKNATSPDLSGGDAAPSEAKSGIGSQLTSFGDVIIKGGKDSFLNTMIIAAALIVGVSILNRKKK